jgi:hypothetical protein
LGAALLRAFEEVEWVRRRPSGRALDVTPAGVRGLDAALGVQAAA